MGRLALTAPLGRLAAHKRVWDKQFRAMSPLTPKPPLTDGPATHLQYFTGRRNVLSLHIIFSLIPRHNLLEWAYNFARSMFDPAFEQQQHVQDEVILDFTLGEGSLGMQGEGPGVWAVVDKSGVLPVIRKERWDAVRWSGVLAAWMPADDRAVRRPSPRPSTRHSLRRLTWSCKSWPTPPTSCSRPRTSAWPRF